ncbi:hypothetical protein B5F28_05545 [Gemmiger sp. An194]|nr:hypothetical protein B5F28_05545 [Gemmiger sp. An194]
MKRRRKAEMNPQSQAILEQGGVDVNGALGRFMGSEALLERFLKRFLQDETLSALQTALAAGDTEAAAAAAHSLKGTSGNLSLNILFERSTAQLGQLRAGDLEGARQAMAGVTEAYTNAVEAIHAVYGEG